jgi:uncharacterized phage infection (PIP) family protein YhgE
MKMFNRKKTNTGESQDNYHELLKKLDRVLKNLDDVKKNFDELQDNRNKLQGYFDESQNNYYESQNNFKEMNIISLKAIESIMNLEDQHEKDLIKIAELQEKLKN